MFYTKYSFLSVATLMFRSFFPCFSSVEFDHCKVYWVFHKMSYFKQYLSNLSNVLNFFLLYSNTVIKMCFVCSCLVFHRFSCFLLYPDFGAILYFCMIVIFRKLWICVSVIYHVLHVFAMFGWFLFFFDIAVVFFLVFPILSSAVRRYPVFWDPLPH